MCSEQSRSSYLYIGEYNNKGKTMIRINILSCKDRSYKRYVTQKLLRKHAKGTSCQVQSSSDGSLSENNDEFELKVVKKKS